MSIFSFWKWDDVGESEASWCWIYTFHTVRNLHFLPKNSTLISRENCRFFLVKNSWKCCGFGLFSCWQVWFHKKNCQKKIWVKYLWKCWGFVNIEFLDNILTFRIVCLPTLFENYSKCRIWIFEFWHFLPIFVLLTLTCLVTLFHRKLQFVKNSPKLTIFGAFLINFCPLKM